MPNDFLEIQNAILTIERAEAESIDFDTGNPLPAVTESIEVGAYFRKARPVKDESGINTNVYPISGYLVETLPDWYQPSQDSIDCTVTGLGRGQFTFEGAIQVAKEQVEIDAGTILQGTFVLLGSGE
jgi:hypothetical protein